VREINLTYFERFIRKLILVETFLILLSLLLFFVLKRDKYFIYSYILGIFVTAVDYYLLVKHSKSTAYRILEEPYFKTGFVWRFLILTGLLLISVFLFTHINFFAIILAVVTATVGLLITTLKYGRERGEWKEA